jgi:hypothetical protein
VSATEALSIACAAGVRIGVEGDVLVLEAAAPPPSAVLGELRRHKAEIIALLRSERDGWTADDWRALFDERAGRAEFDGGLPRAQAQARAFACCVAEWLYRNPAHSAPGSCPGCGGGERTHDPLLPVGTAASSHVWLHSGCWAAWYEARRASAIAALVALGLKPPPQFSVFRRSQRERGRLRAGTAPAGSKFDSAQG